MARGANSASNRLLRVTDTLLLLDGHSLAYRAWFALPVENFATTTGLPTNAVYGFTAMLINVLRDEKPTKVAVAFDRSEPTFRHEKYVEYKAGRTKAPDEFRGQISLIFEVLDALGIRRLSAAGYEADDIIATLATEAEQQGENVLIVTGDRDTFQLVSDSTTVLYNSRGVSDMRRYDPASLLEKYGLTPAQYPDFAALRGDPSDNLPSIPGVGEKTATKWIVEFGSLENLVNRVDEVKGKAGDALRAHLGSVLNNRELTTLIRDLPESVVGATPADLTPRPWDREKIHQLFDTLQFRVLRDRLYQTFPDGLPGRAEGRRAGRPRGRRRRAAAGGAGGFEVDASVLGPDEVAQWLEEHESSERMGLALDGTWGRGQGHADGHRDRRRGRRGRVPRPDRAHPGRRARPRRLARRGRAPEGAARRQGTHARAGIARIRSGRAYLGHRAGRLPRAARPADLRPRRPFAALPRQGAERPRRRQRAADPGRVGRGRVRARARPPGPRDPRPRRRAGRRPGKARRHPAAARDRAAARHRPGRDGADRHRGRHRPLRGDVRDAATAR